MICIIIAEVIVNIKILKLNNWKSGIIMIAQIIGVIDAAKVLGLAA